MMILKSPYEIARDPRLQDPAKEPGGKRSRLVFDGCIMHWGEDRSLWSK